MLTGFTFHSEAASFDCSKAKGFAEKTICSDQGLSKDDDDLKSIYEKAKEVTHNKVEFSKITRKMWNVREGCTNYDCVDGWYSLAFYIYDVIIRTNSNENVDEVKTVKQDVSNTLGKRENKKIKDFRLYDSSNRAAPVEHDAALYSETPEAFGLIDTLVGFVRKSSYECDSVSAFRPLLMSNGYYLVCNKFSYKYDVKNNGGNISVEVDN
jgi:hypothetical protein